MNNKDNFNQMNIVLDDGATIPARAHETDAGYDLCAIGDRLIAAQSSAVIDTGVHIQLPKGYAGLLVSKSGLNVKHDITSTGLIDSGYTGSIKVKLYNHGLKPYQVNDGDKISQLVILKVASPDLVIATSLEDTERGNNGFGSTGR